MKLKIILTIFSNFFFIYLFSQINKKYFTSNKDSIIEYGYWVSKYDSIFKVIWPEIQKRSLINRGNSSTLALYFNASNLDGLITMYQVTEDLKYIDHAKILITNIIDSSKKLKIFTNYLNPYSDGNYYGWVDSSLNNLEKENPLNESIFFRYVVKLLRVIKEKHLRKINKYDSFYTKVLNFTEKNIWSKWYNRRDFFLKTEGITSRNWIYRNRTHLASHWAYIALELSFLSEKKDKVKKEYNEVFEAISFKGLNNKQFENCSLKNQIRNPNFNEKTFTWIYSTWNNKTYFENSTIIPNNNNYWHIQDVSHANHVVSFIIEAYSLKKYWNINDINGLCNLFSNYLFDIKSNSIKNCMLDIKCEDEGTNIQSAGRIPSDCGWIKLGKYNKLIQKIYQNIDVSTYFTTLDPNNKYFLDDVYAQLALNARHLQYQ